MKKTLLFAFSLIIGTSAFAQFPTFDWGHSFTSDHAPASSVTDASGNYYVATSIGDGWGAVNMNPSGTNYTTTISGQWTSVVVKYDANGNFVWMKDFAHATPPSVSPGVAVSSIGINSTGELYLTGTFQGTFDFNLGSGVSSLTAVGTLDVFVLKLDVNGDFLWVKQIGSAGDETMTALAVDANNDIVFCGSFAGTIDFDPNAGITNLTAQGPKDVFVFKLSASGNLLYAKNVGSSSYTDSYALTTDASNNAYVAGVFYDSGDFDPDAGTTVLTSNGGADIFILKLNSSGAFGFAYSFGGLNDEYCLSVKADHLGNLNLAGIFSDIVDFDFTAATLNDTSLGGYDIFVMQINSSGSLAWVKTIGGAADDKAFVIRTNSLDEVLIGGTFNSSVDFDPGAGTTILSAVSIYYDSFVLSLSNTGNLNWVKNLEAVQGAELKLMAIDHADDIIVAGTFYGVIDLDLNAATQNFNSSSNNLFMSKWTDLSTQINEAAQENDIVKFYPNPVNDRVSLSANCNIILTDVTGKMVAQKQNSNSFDMTTLPAGMYFLLLADENGVLIQQSKLLKE